MLNVLGWSFPGYRQITLQLRNCLGSSATGCAGCTCLTRIGTSGASTDSDLRIYQRHNEPVGMALSRRPSSRRVGSTSRTSLVQIGCEVVKQRCCAASPPLVAKTPNCPKKLDLELMSRLSSSHLLYEDKKRWSSLPSHNYLFSLLSAARTFPQFSIAYQNGQLRASCSTHLCCDRRTWPWRPHCRQRLKWHDRSSFGR